MEPIECFDTLLRNLEHKGFKGIDPYDGLKGVKRSIILDSWYIREAMTQIHKWSPLNLRPLFLITPTTMPKAVGIALRAYCNLWHILDKPESYDSQNLVLERMEKLASWLRNNRCKGYNGDCWDFGFNYKNMDSTPTIVITSIIAKGLFEMYKIKQSDKLKSSLIRICDFIIKDLNRTKFGEGFCFSYSPITKDCTYNATLLGTEILAKVSSITGKDYLPLISDSLDFVLNHQHDDGHWNYSINKETGIERKQIDFHQGYILESLEEITTIIPKFKDKCEKHIKEGTNFYKSQFNSEGRSYYRLPRLWPAEIHTQAQAVIFFSEYHANEEELNPNEKLLFWTINNMLSSNGFFHYQKWPYYSNKLNYIRWSQCWMLLALSSYFKNRYAQ